MVLFLSICKIVREKSFLLENRLVWTQNNSFIFHETPAQFLRYIMQGYFFNGGEKIHSTGTKLQGKKKVSRFF